MVRLRRITRRALTINQVFQFLYGTIKTHKNLNDFWNTEFISIPVWYD